MKNKLVQLLMPYAYSLFFTGAMTALIWITYNYGSSSAVPIAAGVCALLYTGVALASIVNVFKGNKLFSGSAADVFSVATQKKIRLAGLLVAAPALIYCAIFAYTVKSFHVNHDVAAVDAFSNFELNTFGSSIVWNYIFPHTQTLQTAPAPAIEESTVSEGKDVDFGPYMSALQCRIKRNWYPPRNAESLRIAVRFKVHEKGDISDVKIVKSSGLDSADAAAVKAVETAAPYKVLPAGAPENVDIEFTFDYNVFGKNQPLSNNEPEFGSGGCSTTDTFSSQATTIDDTHAVRPVQ